MNNKEKEDNGKEGYRPPLQSELPHLSGGAAILRGNTL